MTRVRQTGPGGASLGRVVAAGVFALLLAAGHPAPVLAGASAPAAATTAACPSTHYENSRGQCVRRPTRPSNNRPPAGATARCRDGTYSFSRSRRGTCSHHGGVAAWL